MQNYEISREHTASRLVNADPSSPQYAADAVFMRRCLQLAANGANGAPPNPMVGAVIVGPDGRILGEGFHARCGKGHAEVNAFAAVGEADRALLAESTIYVSLEPCAHFGRTPPCAELIVRRGVKRVVVGCVDPFSRVQGRGIGIIRRAGIEVTVGVLEAECLAMNRRFITSQTHARPFITLKWAVSADGFLDHWRDSAAEAPARLSSPHSLIRVHHLRARAQAIVVGHSTLRLDRPALTVRHWDGEDPLRIVLGNVAEGELPAGFTAFADIDTMLVSLQGRGVQSMLVEGGAQTLQTFIDRGLWDEAFEELSPVVLESGVPAPRMPFGAERTAERVWGRTITHWTNSL